MAKLTLTDLANLQNETTAVNAINNNNAAIETAMENTLSRDGTSPNQMGANFDMNSHQILNLPFPATADSPIRLQDALTLGSGGTISPIPTGGTTRQALIKNSNTDYDATWQRELNTYNVQSYGAVGDGVTDDSTSINNAIAAIRTAGSGRLFFPATTSMTYSVASAVNVAALSNFVMDSDPGVIIKGTAAFNASDNNTKSSIVSGLNFTGTAAVTGHTYKNMIFGRNLTIDGSLGNVSGLPPAAIGNFGYNMCTIEIMNVDNVRIYSTSKGGFGNGPVISTHDPRLFGPSIQTWNITALGSGYAVGNRFYSNDVGDNFSKAIFEVTSVNGSGGVTGVSIVSRGIYLTISGANATTTNITGTGTGCNLQILTYSTARNGILNPVMECDIIDCCRGLLPSYDSVENPGGIAGSGLQIGAAFNADVDCRYTNVGGPALDLFNCTGGRAHIDVYSVSSTPIGATQSRGNFHSDFGMTDMHLSGRVPSVDIRGAMNNGLSYFFNGGTATPGPRNCYMDFDVDGSIAVDTYSPGVRIMGGSIAGLVGQASGNFGRFRIANSNAKALELFDCYQNTFDVIVQNPGTTATNYVPVKLNAQIDQVGSGCISNYIALSTSDTRNLIENNVTTDGTGRNFLNTFRLGSLGTATSTSLNMPNGSFKLVQYEGYETTATAAGTTVLTHDSANIQVFTGTTTQTVTLPLASSMHLGHIYEIFNESTGVVTVNSSGGNLVALLGPNTHTELISVALTGTGAAAWLVKYYAANVFGGKKLSVQNTLTFTGTDGSTVAFGTGGTAAYTGGNLSQFAATTSAQLAGVMSDEVGSAGGGLLVFNNNPAIIGTATNDNAAAGRIGEYVEGNLASGSAIALTTGTAANVTSISLTAGDWDVDGIVLFLPANTTQVSTFQGSLSTTSATLDLANGRFNSPPMPNIAFNGSTVVSVPLTTSRFSLSGTTTVFLITRAVFTVSTCTSYGLIRARRVR